MADEPTKSKQLQFKVHVPRLLSEICDNPSCAILRVPLAILFMNLQQLAARANEINDPKLNAICLRMTLFQQSDPESEHYNPAILEEYERQGL